MPKTIKGKEKLNKEKEKFQKHHIKKKEDTFDNKILAYGLDNAILHEGRCQEGAIIGKSFQEGLKKEELPKVIPTIKKIVSEINKLSLDKQKEKFESLHSLVVKKEHEE